MRGGETLFSLGRKYGVSPFAIADMNGLSHDESLRVGQSLRVPGGKGKSIVSKVPAVEESEQIVSNDDPVVTDDTDDTEQSLTLKKPVLMKKCPSPSRFYSKLLKLMRLQPWEACAGR